MEFKTILRFLFNLTGYTIKYTLKAISILGYILLFLSILGIVTQCLGYLDGDYSAKNVGATMAVAEHCWSEPLFNLCMKTKLPAARLHLRNL